MPFEKITESESLYQNLEQQSVEQLLLVINTEDQKVALAVKSILPSIQKLTEQVIRQLKKGGRLFYIGAGTSGRLGILDASECPPTFGVSPDRVVGIIAGGDLARPRSGIPRTIGRGILASRGRLAAKVGVGLVSGFCAFLGNSICARPPSSVPTWPARARDALSAPVFGVS